MHIEKDKVEQFVARVLKTGTPDAREISEDDGSWFCNLAEQRRRYYSNEIAVDLGVPMHIYEALHEHYQEEKNRSFQMIVNQILQAAKEPEGAKCSRLASFPEMLRLWLMKNGQRGWVYSTMGERHLAYLVESANYNEGSKRDNVSPSVRVTMHASIPGKSTTDARRSFVIEHSCISGQTVGQIMIEKGFLPESEDLNAEYEAARDHYLSLMPNNLKQHRISGVGYIEEKYHRTKEVMRGERVVLDLESAAPQRLVSMGVRDYRSPSPLPFHPVVRFFHLGKHKLSTAHALDLTLYEWRRDLGSKLVLPKHHTDLIEVLTEDGEVLREDIVEGKTGGTVILCKGPAGVGKTLTAEVYSEVTQRPLYRVHSGQLGIDPKFVETALEDSFKRATRYNAVLLIDEADVFVRSRGTDILQNAMTSVFLRMLEYWDGLLFMTTNRAMDIDDAIISRCMAVIDYQKPGRDEREALWKILSKQFDVALTDDLCAELASAFEGMAGRDIKGVLRLTKRYAERRGETYSVDLFRRMGMFRGG